LYPKVRLLLLCFFFPIRDRVCVALLFVAASSSTLPRMRLSLRLPRLQRRCSWSSHHHRCRRHFRRWRHPLPVFVKLALDSSPRLLPFPHGHRHRCCCRKTLERFLAASSTIAIPRSPSCCFHRQEAADFVYSGAFVDASDPRPLPRLRPRPPRPQLLRH